MTYGLYRYHELSTLDFEDEDRIVLYHNIHLTNLGGDPPIQRTISNTQPNNLFIRFEKDNRKIEIIADDNHVQVVIAASDNPLTDGELGLLLELLDFIYGLDFEKGNWEVSSIEIGKDFEQYRVDGANCITFREFRNLWLRAYNKHNVLRVEAVLHHTNLPDLIRFLQGKGNMVGQAELIHEVKDLNKGVRGLRKVMDKHLLLNNELEQLKNELEQLKKGDDRHE